MSTTSGLWRLAVWYAEKALEIALGIVTGIYELILFGIVASGPIGIIFLVGFVWIGFRYVSPRASFYRHHSHSHCAAPGG